MWQFRLRPRTLRAALLTVDALVERFDQFVEHLSRFRAKCILSRTVTFQHPGLLAGAAVLAGAMALAGWLDYRATTGELQAALRAEATALHTTVAAAARVQHAAAAEAERALGQRLLENARLLAVMDRRGGIDQATLDRIVGETGMFRLVVFEADGRRSYAGGEAPVGSGRGPGGGAGAGVLHQGLGGGGLGFGPPAGSSRIAQRLLSGEMEELVSGAHASRGGGGERVAAGVRRASGGAIVLNAANRAARELDQVYSLDALISQVATATPALAYVILQDETGRVARGPLAGAIRPEAAPAGNAEALLIVDGVPVVERRGTVALDESRRADLRIGMRLDDIRRAERRSLIRITTGFSAVGALTVLALAFGSLRTRYGVLSERHQQAQDALRRRDRLAAMGELASTVAHEIRNPLNAIAMSAQRLAREYPIDSLPQNTREDAEELVGVIQREASRINTTVQQFLDFARPRPLNVRVTDLGSLVAEIAGAASALAGSRGVRLETDIEDAPSIAADPDQLRQVIDNLIRNAIDATPNGGIVSLWSGRAGGAAFIEVRDTGSGIAPDILPKIFDLYFTTKRDGTGVGLAIAHQIVAAHGGSIEVDSSPGTGTRMVIRLPEQGVNHG